MMTSRAAACALSLLAAWSAFADTSAPSPAKGRYRAIVLSAEEARACRGNRETFRTPSTAEIKKLESSLIKELTNIAEHGKNDYFRSRAKEVLERAPKDVLYFTGTLDGQISVEGFCEDFSRKGERCPPLVEDGGSCIWRIRFDPKRGTFDHFGTNGEA